MRGKKEATDCLLPGRLRSLGFASLLLALCWLFPRWMALAANVAFPPESPTHRTGYVSHGPAPGVNAADRTASLPILTTAKAVHSLTRSQAELHYPVHLRAVCVVCFAEWHGFWVYDGVSGVYVETKNHVPLTAAIHPGIVLI